MVYTFKTEGKNVKSFWRKMEGIWWGFWGADEDVRTGGLSPTDKRWLLYWNFMSCMGTVLLFLLVTGINNIRVTRENGKDVEKAMSMIATYMATATKDEYDDIAATIRHDLIFSEYGEDIGNLIQYIPNTADYCRTCLESYPAQALLVCANTGQSYSLDLYDNGADPDGHYGGTTMYFGYDEVSQTSLHVSKHPDQQTGSAVLDRGCGIVSAHRMKTLFCDDCIQKILETVEHQLIEEFVIYDTEAKKFFPIDDGTIVQIGDYSLEMEYRDNNYKITINYTGK